MSNARFVFPFLILAVLAVLVVLPGSSLRPSPVAAADCSTGATGTIVIEIYDDASSSLLTFGGADVLVDPDPRDFDLDHVVVDSDSSDASGAEDKNPASGVIRLDGACSTQGNETYTATLLGLPGDFRDCEVSNSSDSGQVAVGGSVTLNLEVDCTGVLPTPAPTLTVTPTVTSTPAPAAEVTVVASPQSVGCNGTSTLTVEVLDAGGKPVKVGTQVSLGTTLGTISPASGATNSEGKVVTTYTGPATSSGSATITASTGSVSSVAFIAVQCNPTASGTIVPVAAATQQLQPPPSTGVITPPNTGDAGLQPGKGHDSLLAVALVSGLLVAVSLTARRHFTNR